MYISRDATHAQPHCVTESINPLSPNPNPEPPNPSQVVLTDHRATPAAKRTVPHRTAPTAPKLSEREVARQYGGSSFAAADTHTNVRGANHAHIVGTIAYP